MDTEHLDPALSDALVLQLCAEFGVAETVVREHAAHLLSELAGARIRMFVPLLVERRLRAYARSLRVSP